MGEKNMFDLSDRVAVVTGGGFGIGRSISQGLAEFGAKVVVADINMELAEETAGLLSGFGHGSLAVKADVTKSDEIENMFKQAVERFGTVDILVNNAGAIMGMYMIHETPENLWDRIIALNFKAAFLCTKAVVPIMLKQKKGSIINVASVGGILPGDRDMMGSVYDSAKAGIIVFSRKAAAEYGRDGIRINAIAPGMVSGTNFASDRRRERPADDIAARKLEDRISKIALGRSGTADEMKGIVIYLASDAASYATGQVFVIDGGLS